MLPITNTWYPFVCLSNAWSPVTDPADGLAAAVVAHVLQSEHRDIGLLDTRHRNLYERMKVADLAQLPMLARERYTNSGLELVAVPHVIDPANELNDEPR